jgi:hypothetical protein
MSSSVRVPRSDPIGAPTTSIDPFSAELICRPLPRLRLPPFRGVRRTSARPHMWADRRPPRAAGAPGGLLSGVHRAESGAGQPITADSSSFAGTVELRL